MASDVNIEVESVVRLEICAELAEGCNAPITLRLGNGAEHELPLEAAEALARLLTASIARHAAMLRVGM
jgi:dsRNA-specific ribonuclease